MSNLGRHVFGVAVFAFGLVALVWPDYYDSLQLRHFLNARDVRIFDYAASGAQIAGGVALEFRRTARTGAVILAVVYLVFSLLCVPQIVAAPQKYDRWGNFFEQFSLATGAALAYAGLSRGRARQTLYRIGRMCFGVCVASFTIEQAIHLDVTAGLVPKWFPPNQMFWAIATTVLLALAAVALVTNRMALVAGRLLTAMLASFGIFVWLPLLPTDPTNHGNWSETAETFAITGAAWILADLLGELRPSRRGYRSSR